ncbi:MULTISPECIES: gamma-glutamyl-gamma-aminobutyrate hydrolase family protein [Streptomyces]|uniref:Gamma-glutamyl-gamma-aminobutyrate hydrolase n=1 Tax=Streptomyces spororaveus TaxID=284039 RepID=A0ABQ3TL45_9ACTN|nr:MULTISPECIES: gamma-glutamyl-gamma-aminobutyrate hydrolase family protein [Streptomyces]MCM9078581.1 gamma-glutamyl-gamma-aminobutyrate hydrolase family protein [Streptomyces spororaveus]MCX5307003.1 gamma-glutamyl-gamma-aminobutyrate hydrolase family protein [Streptomyces sp. NBC_00160]GHI81098.1 gamma-glutamyl-gamma-aminobutyrate hydrolase [Streptomyces spororaveus]
MPRPLIGITTYVEDSTRYGVWDLPTSLVPTGYYELVQAAGGAAVLLPPDEPGSAAEVLSRVDGLVVAGGPDLDPVHYGAARDSRTGAPATVRDHWELALIAAALDADMPLLGICRGMQALNVALGGTLIQHIDGHFETPGATSWHPVRPVPGTRYADLVPQEAQVPTYHHQAVDRLGRGLVVSAHAVDGTVEAIELPDPERWVLGVQWHPERDTDTRVMSALVEAAAVRTPVPVG